MEGVTRDYRSLEKTIKVVKQRVQSASARIGAKEAKAVNQSIKIVAMRWKEDYIVTNHVSTVEKIVIVKEDDV